MPLRLTCRYAIALVWLTLAPIADVSAEEDKPHGADDPATSFLALHPDNPHYFQWHGDPTILVTSGEHYGAVLNLDFDYVTYLDELQRHGLNHTRTFSGVYRENAKAFRITDNTLAPAANRFICPWARSDQPGYNAGGNRFDLTKWDEKYFRRLKDFLSQAAGRGIIVELTLFCPMYNDAMWDDCPMKSSNNINGVGDCAREEVYTGKQHDLMELQLALIDKIVRELRDFGNVYYEVCNEPYFGGVTIDWQRAIVAAIAHGERDFPRRHLISLNIANGRQKIEQSFPNVSIFNFHYCVPPDTVAMNDALNKVIGENETGFRGSDDLLYRTEGWDFLMAGGAIYNNLDYSFTVKHPDGSLSDYTSPGGGSVALRKQLGILKVFFNQLDFVHMQPDDSVVRRLSPKLSVSALSQHRQDYAIYIHVPLPNKPKNLLDHVRDNIEATIVLDLPAGHFDAQWLNTVTGKIEKKESFQQGTGDRTLVSPKFSNDVALRVTRTRP